MVGVAPKLLGQRLLEHQHRLAAVVVVADELLEQRVPHQPLVRVGGVGGQDGGLEEGPVLVRLPGPLELLAPPVLVHLGLSFCLLLVGPALVGVHHEPEDGDPAHEDLCGDREPVRGEAACDRPRSAPRRCGAVELFLVGRRGERVRILGRDAPCGFRRRREWPLLANVSGTDALLALVALAAGTVDAIGGGGGLLTVPALLAAGLPPHLALATNKGQSVFGAAAALVRFSRAGLVPFHRARWTSSARVRRRAGRCAAGAVDAPGGPPAPGAGAARGRGRPRPPSAPGGGGRAASAAMAPAAALALASACTTASSVPGTGTLLIVGWPGCCPCRSSRPPRRPRRSTSPATWPRRLLFAARGRVVWHTALPMAAGQLVGGWLGAHLTVRGGERIVRWVVLSRGRRAGAQAVVRCASWLSRGLPRAARRGHSPGPRGGVRRWRSVASARPESRSRSSVRAPGRWRATPPVEALAALQTGLDAGHDPRRHRRAVRRRPGRVAGGAGHRRSSRTRSSWSPR